MNEHNDAHSRLHLVSRNHLIVVYPTNPQFSVADIPSQRLGIFLFKKGLTVIHDGPTSIITFLPIS